MPGHCFASDRPALHASCSVFHGTHRPGNHRQTPSPTPAPQREVLLRGGVHDQTGGYDGKDALCIAHWD